MRRSNTVYAPSDESILMYRLFPNPKKIKPIRKEDILGERGRQLTLGQEDDLNFMFRGEFEKCGTKINGDILKYQKRKRKEEKKKFNKLGYYWEYVR